MEDKSKYYYKIISKVVILAFILLGIFLTYKVAVFYMPFLIALLIATIVEPLIRFFVKKTKMERKLASIVSLILVLILIGSILVGLSIKIIAEGNNIISNLNINYNEVYDWSMNLVNDLKEGIIQLEPETIDILKNLLGGFLESAKDVVYSVLTGLINTITSIPTIITYGVITILAVVFICFDREYIIKVCRKHIPSKWLEKAKQVIKETCSVAIKYIKAEAKLSAICFILVIIGLVLLDTAGFQVQYPVIMAIFIGFIDLLPLFGAGAVMLPWTVYLYIMGNVPLAIAVLIIWIIWAVLKQFLEPKVISKQMNIHPIFTLIGMYTGFRLFGVLGLMIGPIILIICKNIFSELINKGVLKTFFEKE